MATPWTARRLYATSWRGGNRWREPQSRQNRLNEYNYFTKSNIPYNAVCPTTHVSRICLEQSCQSSKMNGISKPCRILLGVLSMERPTALVATFATGLALLCIVTGLAVTANQKDACNNPALICGLKPVPECALVPSSTDSTANHPTPTLAPPRPASTVGSLPSSTEVANGQPVFLNVETDQNEIEVGWASP
jgi:hypothetical protein